MSKKIEKMQPIWEPGTDCGYHTLTFGFLIDQIVRRVDEQKRGVVQYLEDEVINKHGSWLKKKKSFFWYRVWV